MMKLPLTGGCLCGALRYEIGAAPALTYACHCRDCQRLTSSAFSIAIVVPDAAFRLTQGTPRAAQKTADSGRVITRWLCPECASWITSEAFSSGVGGQQMRRVRAGTLDDTSWLHPTTHYWTRSKQPWVALPEGGEVYETQPF